MKSLDILEENGITYQMIELEAASVSCQQGIEHAAQDIEQDEICKTIITVDNTGRHFAFMVKGDEELDLDKAAEIVGEPVTLVDIDRLKEVTGEEPGTICPLTLDVPLYVDNAVFNTDRINFSTGHRRYRLEIASHDLDDVIDFEHVDVTT